MYLLNLLPQAKSRVMRIANGIDHERPAELVTRRFLRQDRFEPLSQMMVACRWGDPRAAKAFKELGGHTELLYVYLCAALGSHLLVFCALSRDFTEQERRLFDLPSNDCLVLPWSAVTAEDYLDAFPTATRLYLELDSDPSRLLVWQQSYELMPAQAAG